MTSAAAMKLSVPKVSERAVACCVPPLALRKSRCANKAQICAATQCCDNRPGVREGKQEGEEEEGDDEEERT